ncbi:MAG: tRNA guanosine(34) transglycosylase Tgt, partial [bacterium]|nr:tRNA guanosine(34) transglycosylase Tgt [bacterium]
MTDINVKREQRLQFSVEAEAENSSARACTFKTLHNQVQTPVFMPVATFASIRSQSIVSVDELEFPVLLANTYHLLLRPGTAVFKEFGGIHPFMNWKRSILTDSGGYQVFSLAKTVKITEEGAAFRSYLDGNLFLLSPETSIETQRIIGSDIMMVMDQCVASTSPESVCREAADITARWAERSLAARGDSPQSVFGIVQGACSPDLRKTSARQITSLPFDGYAIGGLAVGETEEERKDITEMTAALLPRNYPRYLMGVGTPLDLLEAVHRGVDMFDCILPTALGQQGVAYTTQGRIELRRGVYKLSTRPLDENCTCVACTRYTRGYLHHLIKTKEHYGSNLVGLHNLTFYRNLMNSMREHILAGDFFSYYKEQREALARDDEEYPAVPPVSKKRKNKQEQVLGAYKVIRQGEGFHSILHKSSGEIMHSVNDPLTEARALYVKQAGLKEMLTAPGEEDVVIWDVGLGAATNVMATLFEYEKIFAAEPPLRGLKIISFENDLDSLRLAVRNPAHFHHIRHAAPAGILKNGRWESPRFQVEWELLEGDFSEKMETADKPHCIYYDPFSLKTNGPLWSFPLFERIYQRCASPSARLFTYSNSTRVRSALLAAGFYVGEGVGTGPKASTTVAMSSIGEGTSGIELLGSDWLQR